MRHGRPDLEAFDAALAADGFGQVETKVRPPGAAGEHAHGFEVRALVLEGTITLTWNGVTRTFSPGEVFTMAAHCPHAEVVGPGGVRYRVGTRR